MTSTPKPPVEPSFKVSKHIDRIKREEDEDQWISGEELYTEGSSDEEDKGKSKDNMRRVKREHRGARPKMQRRAGKSETSLSPAPKPPGIDIPPVDKDSDSGDESVPVDISWKPKRGSIRLPHLLTDSCDALQRHNPLTATTTDALNE